MKPDLRVTLAGIAMRNPVMTASGTCGYAEELAPYADLSGLGAVVVKTITLHPRVGNPAPRIAESPSGMLNSIGLQNVGIEAFLREKLPVVRRLKVPILV
ncbi:MAG: dihydroorotate dehydrogenase, partial [Candidatus Methylomirabilales bacterium]